jgi:hypothetical protein
MPFLSWFEEVEWTDTIDAALDKLPAYNGTVYRSVSDYGIEDVEAFIAGHVPDDTKRYDQYTSSGVQVYDESFPVQYVIQSKTGVDIRSLNPGEHEILFRRGTEFEITKVENGVIFMKEV